MKLTVVTLTFHTLLGARPLHGGQEVEGGGELCVTDAVQQEGLVQRVTLRTCLSSPSPLDDVCLPGFTHLW